MSQKNHREPRDARGRLPHLLRIDELAERLGVSVRHLRRLVQERRIPSLKVGHFVMFDEGEIAGRLEQCRRPGESRPTVGTAHRALHTPRCPGGCGIDYKAMISTTSSTARKSSPLRV